MSGFVERNTPGKPVDDDTRQAPALQRKTPTLADVLPLALAARQRGDSWIDVEMSGLGREWAPRAAIKSDHLPQFGLWGRVVARHRERPTNAALEIDKGPIARILVRYNVIEVLDMCRREQVARMTPRAVLPINQRRPRPRNVTIR